MQLKLAVLADYATTTDQGKLVLGGVFDTLMMQRFPGVHPQMAVAIRLAAGPEEGTSHHVTVRLLDPQGGDVIPAMEGDLEFRGVGTVTGGGAQLVLHLNQVEFKAEGPYRFEIASDGEPVGSIDLAVYQAPPAAATRH